MAKVWLKTKDIREGMLIRAREDEQGYLTKGKAYELSRWDSCDEQADGTIEGFYFINDAGSEAWLYSWRFALGETMRDRVKKLLKEAQ